MGKNERVFISVANIDAFILDKAQWQTELNRQRFVCWLTLFLPKQAIWKRECKIDIQSFDRTLFIESINSEMEKDIAKMKKKKKKKKNIKKKKKKKKKKKS